jgi:hypothetical protein
MSNANNSIDKPIRQVSALSVRRELLGSLIKEKKPRPRLNKIAANTSRISILINIQKPRM